MPENEPSVNRPFEPLEEPPDVRARRLAELEDDHMDSLSFDPDFEKWLSHIPASAWLSDRGKPNA